MHGIQNPIDDPAFVSAEAAYWRLMEEREAQRDVCVQCGAPCRYGASPRWCDSCTTSITGRHQ